MVTMEKHCRHIDAMDEISDCYEIQGPPGERRTAKKKRVEDDDLELIVDIDYAEDIDNPCVYGLVYNRHYQVVFWVDPARQYFTELVKGDLDPRWKKRYRLPLDKRLQQGFLHVEVLRCNCIDDPGTSKGIAMVGRTRIPLPKLSYRKGGRYGLVRLEGTGYKAEGRIMVVMELREMARNHFR